MKVSTGACPSGVSALGFAGLSSVVGTWCGERRWSVSVILLCGIGANFRRPAVASRHRRVYLGGWCCLRGARSAGLRLRVCGRRHAAWRCLYETTSGWSVASRGQRRRRSPSTSSSRRSTCCAGWAGFTHRTSSAGAADGPRAWRTSCSSSLRRVDCPRFGRHVLAVVVVCFYQRACSLTTERRGHPLPSVS